ncbi:MAG: SDR family NAD(P)-dependent oxidoreductase [Pirellulales bacterium]|nr:SDR family NAD(P)-dependent oxidoreductase [Pirellulales bacterium]
MQLARQTFVVTGGASGLGAAVAKDFLAAGANVALLDRQPCDLGGFSPIDQALCHSLLADVTQFDQVVSAFDQALARFGSIQGVVHCAGVIHAEKILGKSGPHDAAAFAKVLQINLIGTFHVLTVAATRMTSSPPQVDDERGVIILTSSIAASEGQIGQIAYAASKAGVAGLTLPAARELARHGIRVVTIAPGVFDTHMLAGLRDDARDSLATQVPFPRRLGQPAEFAALARHIVENALLNGCVIRLDGGLRMSAQ